MPDAFFWYDVMTTDLGAAETFYRRVVGWGTQDTGATPQYTLFTVDGRGVAGLMAIPDDALKAGVPPAWMGYIQVDDVDDMAARVVREGGKLHKDPVDVPGIIRFAVVSDPQGAGFIIAKPMSAAANPPPLAAGTPGTIGWHELYAGEWKSAFAFYEKLFGWTKADALDMGEMGIYQLFAAGGIPIGGMMTKPLQIPHPYWGYYINVAAIDAAAARVTAAGGTIVNGPMQVPGGQWIVQAIDPQGAGFALVAPAR